MAHDGSSRQRKGPGQSQQGRDIGDQPGIPIGGRHCERGGIDPSRAGHCDGHIRRINPCPSQIRGGDRGNGSRRRFGGDLDDPCPRPFPAGIGDQFAAVHDHAELDGAEEDRQKHWQQQRKLLK